MDVVLEVFDTFLFDKVYAKALPRHTDYTAFDAISTIAASLKGFADPYANATWQQQQQQGLSGAAGGVGMSASSWLYQPSTQYFSLQPGADAWASRWDRDNVWRQLVSLYIITWLFGLVIYFSMATLSYVFIFDKNTCHHPKYLKNQMRLEIQQTVTSIPIMAIFTVPFFLAEVRGHSFIYDTIAEPGVANHFLIKLFGRHWNWLQFPVFLCFTDFFIYWIHRSLHHPFLYKRLHKPHHKWIMPTPFASHAFHPIDGYSQSVPYHLFPFIFPLQKFAYIALFTFIQVWTVMIHDGEYVANSPIINGAACHTMHHLYFNYNYGQFTTLWDRMGGSYRKPNDELFRRETKMGAAEWNRQVQEMERKVLEVEGEDDRRYGPPDEVVKKVQ